MKNNLFIVILAGGIGLRFWPYSRNNKPKQFLDLLGTGRTLLQMTFDRFAQQFPVEQFLVVTNKIYVDWVKEQLPELKEEQILIEPLRRNTAASVALASYKINKIDSEAKVIVSPSDQWIINEKVFFATLEEALKAANQEGTLLTLGIHPNRPETSYGYIQYKDGTDSIVKKVKTFTEKPTLKLAVTFIESGDFVWNSGIFVWKNKSIIKAFENYLPEFAEVFEEGEGYFCTEKEQDFLKKAYSLIKNNSIDYGIMEKSDMVYVILGDFGWSDLGSWQNLYELREHDNENNVVEANALLYDTNNCYVKVSPEKLVVVQGLDNYLINENGNVLLICKLKEEDKFREFINDAKEKGEGFV